MRAVLVSLVLVSLVASPVLAQSDHAATPEFRPIVGALVPTGDQRDVIEDAPLGGVQFGLELHRDLHLCGTFAYARSEHRALASRNAVNVWQMDVGLEKVSAFSPSNTWRLRPFAGLGAGVRIFDYGNRESKAENCPAVFGALGVETQSHRLALRLEAREYATRFRGIRGGETASVRGDLFAMGSLALHFR